MNGARILARQKRLIAELQADGHDTTSAEALLSTLISTQRIFEDHMRDAIKTSGLRNRDSAPIIVGSFPQTYATRSAKMERIARAMSAGWMMRAGKAQTNRPKQAAEAKACSSN